METRWSDWENLTIDNIKAVPASAVYAVYEIRLADGSGNAVAVKRALILHQLFDYLPFRAENRSDLSK